MSLQFKDDGAEDIFRGDNTKKARKTCPKELHDTAKNKLHMIDSAKSEDDLKNVPGNRFEYLGGTTDRASIRINDQFRIEFTWVAGNAYEVAISKHYGD